MLFPLHVRHFYKPFFSVREGRDWPRAFEFAGRECGLPFFMAHGRVRSGLRCALRLWISDGARQGPGCAPRHTSSAAVQPPRAAAFPPLPPSTRFPPSGSPAAAAAAPRPAPTPTPARERCRRGPRRTPRGRASRAARWPQWSAAPSRTLSTSVRRARAGAAPGRERAGWQRWLVGGGLVGGRMVASC